MSSKKVKPEKKKSRGSYETVELPAQEVKKALAQLQAVAVSERENREDREDRDGESFESKIERAMQKIVSDTLGDEPIDHISSAQRAPKAKTAGTVKVARAKGIRLDESLVRKEGVPEEKEATAAKEPEVPRPQKKAREEKDQREKDQREKDQKEKSQEEDAQGQGSLRDQDKIPEDLQEKDPGKDPEKIQKKTPEAPRPKPIRQERERPVITPQPEKKSRRGLVAASVIIGVLLVGTVGVYAGVGNYYQDRFLPGTSINHIDCSGMTEAQAEQLIRRSVEDYSLTVYARDAEPQVITAEAIDYKYQPHDDVQKLLEEQEPMRWVDSFFNEHAYTVGESISYDREKVRVQMGQLDCMQPDRQIQPVDAHLEYQDGEFTIIPETAGTALDAEKVLELVCKCVEESQESLDLEEQDVYFTAAVTKDDQSLVEERDHLNSYARASITYTFGDETEVLNGEVIRNWIHVSEDGSVDINDEALEQNVYNYVAELAARRDTLGANRTFTASSGRTVNVAGGNYGWQIDQYAEAIQLLEEIKNGEVVTREPNYASTAMHAGSDDIGDTYIEVDLAVQHMYYYREGALIFESDFVSGKPEPKKQTPTGVCHLYYKKLDEVLRGEKQENGEYEYETPVQYWMPFNGGVGFHDAAWQPSFGGDMYVYNGSHGCINLPPEKAAELYEIIDTETPIVVFN